MTTADIKQKLSTAISRADRHELHTLLDSFSNSERRAAERVLREQLLPTLPNAGFWTAYLHLIIYRRQAYLSCILATQHLAAADTLDFHDVNAQEVAHVLNPRERLKVADMLLPMLVSLQQIDDTFRWLAIDDEKQQASLLIRQSHKTLCCYALFITLRHAHDPHPLALRCYHSLLRRASEHPDSPIADHAYNMASIVRTYFGLDDASGSLSLNVRPYEISYIDSSYEHFLHVLNGRRPQI